jgi:hypothetical protein
MAMAAPNAVGPMTDGEIGNQSEADAHHRHNQRRDEDDFFPAERVGEMSGGNRAENHRDHQRQADEGQRQRRVRPLVKLPVNRHDEHLLAERRDETPDEVARVIRVLQNRVGAFLLGLDHRLVRQIFWRFLVVHETTAHKLAENLSGSSFR